MDIGALHARPGRVDSRAYHGDPTIIAYPGSLIIRITFHRPDFGRANPFRKKRKVLYGLSRNNRPANASLKTNPSDWTLDPMGLDTQTFRIGRATRFCWIPNF